MVNSKDTGTIGCGTLNATNGVAVLEGSTIYANLTKYSLDFNTTIKANAGVNSNGALATNHSLIATNNWTRPSKGFTLVIDGNNNEAKFWGATNLEFGTGSIVMGTGKLIGTATNAESLNGWSISVDAYSAAANTLSFV
jgi:hypothetical protein